MTPADLQRLETWYAAYAERFLGGDAETDRAVRLKIAHTARVRKHIVRIAQALGISGERLRMADAAALLHDTGRFRQFRDYGTFIDAVSVNHARMGLREIGKAKVLAGLETVQRREICGAVALHNAQRVPDEVSPEVRLLTRLLRDADKVDIFDVTLGSYEGTDSENTAIVDLGLPDPPTCTPAIVEAVFGGHVAPFAQIRCLNDFKLAQMSWIFDIQFAPTLRILSEKRIVERLAAVLPHTPKITAAVCRVKDEMQTPRFEAKAGSGI